MTAARVTVTAGARRPLDRGGIMARARDYSAPPGPVDEARRSARRVRCGECGGQATADRGRVFIAHGPRCSRAAPVASAASSTAASSTAASSTAASSTAASSTAASSTAASSTAASSTAAGAEVGQPPARSGTLEAAATPATAGTAAGA